MTIRELTGRVVSVLIALAYLVGAFVGGGPAGAVKCAVALLLPLACIWFSEPMGDYTGSTARGGITNSSPAWLISLAGWMLLLAPLAVLIVQGLRSLL